MKRTLVIISLVVAAALSLLYRPAVGMDKLQKKYADEYSSFIPVGEMDVHYRKTGQGFPVLLIHGTSSSLHTWHYWHDILSEHFTVYSVDLPGCGLTGPHPDDDYSIAAYLEFLESFTTDVGLSGFHIAGNSLGGHIAWEYAAVSSKVSKAVLVNPSGFHMEDRKVPMVFKLGKKKLFAAIVEGLNVKPLIIKSLREVYYNDDQITPELQQRYFDLVRRKGNRKAFVRKVANTEVGEVGKLRSVGIPVLVQWGKQDVWIPVELADVFTENLPDHQLIVYDECGHVPQEEIPERSAQDAMAFLLEAEDGEEYSANTGENSEND
jgi:pimeloyl-ACP methyl ester carboxylesterase